MNAVERLFLEHDGTELEVPSRDYGRDARLIFPVEGGAAGYSTSLQVKGTRQRDRNRIAFVWTLKIRNILFLNECQAPAYYVFHFCRPGETPVTYAEEVHELVKRLEAIDKKWHSAKSGRVRVTIQRDKTLLNERRIAWISREARAWAQERTATKRAVEFLRGESSRFSAGTDAHAQHRAGSAAMLRSRGAIPVALARHLMKFFCMMANLEHSRYLCHLYGERQSAAMLPFELTSSSRSGVVQLTQLSEEIHLSEDCHRELLAATPALEGAALSSEVAASIAAAVTSWLMVAGMFEAASSGTAAAAGGGTATLFPVGVFVAVPLLGEQHAGFIKWLLERKVTASDWTTVFHGTMHGEVTFTITGRQSGDCGAGPQSSAADCAAVRSGELPPGASRQPAGTDVSGGIGM